MLPNSILQYERALSLRQVPFLKHSDRFNSDFLNRIKEILLKVGFIEEMSTTRGDKQVPEILLLYSPNPRK